jgi:pyruvate dehydrogenase E1 component alpha subunit
MLPALPRADQIALLRTMLRIRHFEEALIELARTHQVGHFHVYIGQEGTGAPALALLGQGDVAYTTHRNHGHLIARGADPATMLAEILGRTTGTNRGKSGTLHLASGRLGFPATSASVGGCLPLAVGSAFAFRQLGRDRVSVCLFGDGALEEGAWHEAANIAVLRALPVVFLCENNSLGAPAKGSGAYPTSTLAVGTLADLAAPFGMPRIVVDGSDTGAVHDATSEAIDRARRGGGPSFIEAQTVRWPGNQGVWPELVTGSTRVAYAWDEAAVPADHRPWFAEHDAVVRCARELLEVGVSRSELEALEADVRAEMEAAVRFALESGWPGPGEAFEDVFGDPRVAAMIGPRDSHPRGARPRGARTELPA